MTPTQLETELREALSARADELPPDAGARLRRIDYRPRSRRIRPQLALGAVIGTAGGAGAIAATVALTTATSNAFAGWTPKPTTASRAQIASAEAACRARLAHTPNPPTTPGGRRPPALDAARLPAQLVDTRGPFTFTIFANSHDSASCITGPGFVSLLQSQTSGASAVPADQLMDFPISHASRDGQPYSLAEGRAGTNVTRAALKLTEGRTVQATVAHGWFVAWWPGNSDATAIQVTTPAGTRTQKIPIVPPLPSGSGHASMSMSGTGAGRAPAGRGTVAQMQSQTTRRSRR